MWSMAIDTELENGTQFCCKFYFDIISMFQIRRQSMTDSICYLHHGALRSIRHLYTYLKDMTDCIAYYSQFSEMFLVNLASMQQPGFWELKLEGEQHFDGATDR